MIGGDGFCNDETSSVRDIVISGLWIYIVSIFLGYSVEIGRKISLVDS